MSGRGNNSSPRYWAICRLALSITVLWPLLTVAQSYPAKPIRIVVPFPAGGSVDILARTIGQKFTEAWGHPTIIENRAGGSSNIGSEFVAKSAPDGYTLLAATSTALAVNPSLFPKLGFDPQRDFAPITLATYIPSILVVHPSLPAKNVTELIALAKARANQLNYASAGSGTPGHLGMELFKTLTGTQIIHVPYKGGAPAVADTVGGQVMMDLAVVPDSLPFVKGGRLRALGVSTFKRSSIVPEIPTIAESGVPGYEVIGWYGFLAPAGTPRDIVTKLHDEIVRALHLPDIKERLVGLGFEVAGDTPEQFGNWMKTERVKWAKVIRDSGAKAE
jgi:tripartite-type tricarboxylate transporter receptor subunit TctC